MSQAGLLYSGGADSSLAALLLNQFHEVTLLTGTFGITEDWRHAAAAAEALGFPHQSFDLDRSVALDAIDQMRTDGYPNTGIQLVHEHALERAAGQFSGVTVIADGTRRDDRVPTIDTPTAQSIEDRHDIDYVTPLAGYGHRAINRLTDRLLTTNVGPSETIPKGDYEAELRVCLREHGESVDAIFPAHEQSVVTGRH